MSKITEIKAREVLDSRGNPTVEVDVVLADGAWGRTSVPSGASTGASEAHELRDGDPQRFRGIGVLKAVENVHRHIAPAMIGRSALDQDDIDRALIQSDATANKSGLGANAVLGVSLAVAHAAARSTGKPLYSYLDRGEGLTLPVPMFNIINGGRHAENSTDIQEFMVVPAGFSSFREAYRAGAEVYHALRGLLSAAGSGTAVGDEGGFVPSLSSNHEAVELVVAAIEQAGYLPGSQCFIALDVAASELVAESADGAVSYRLPREGVVLTPKELIELYGRWAEQYPIVSIEDGMAEEDWNSWQSMQAALGGDVQLVGDDLYATNPDRLRRGIESKASNAVLIKPNQIGTLIETLEAVSMAKEAEWSTILSHRSGETEDTTIADLAVATAASQIKSGAPARGERTAKYNRLLRIEEELGSHATFAGRSVYESFL